MMRDSCPLFSMAGVKYTTSVVDDEPRRSLKTTRFGKHCIHNLWDEYVIIGRFLQPYIGQAVVVK